MKKSFFHTLINSIDKFFEDLLSLFFHDNDPNQFNGTILLAKYELVPIVITTNEDYKNT